MSSGPMIKKYPPYPSRGLVIAAANMLKAEGNSGFEAMRLEYDLLDTNAGLGTSLAGRATSLATFAIENPERQIPEGVYLQSAIVARAGDFYRRGVMNNIGEKERDAFKRASSSAGTLNDVSDSGESAVLLEHEDVSQLVVASHSPKSPASLRSSAQSGRKVFIVHGHDNASLQTVARFLERLKFEAIILHEQANRGRTIIEKIEAHNDVGFAVILLTPDDVGGRTGQAQRSRARQNVILELGYFIAKLGRERVCALKRGDIELPSDFDGVVYQCLDDAGGWRAALARELDDVGFEIDWKEVGRS